MKKTLLLILLTHLIYFNGMSQSNFINMENEIKNVILKAEKAASVRDVPGLNEILHENYRVVANRFKGSKETTVLSKELYLKMMQEGKIGGTPYETEFIAINITDHTATADIMYKIEGKPKMHKYLFLVRTADDSWKIVSDLPVVIQ